MAFLHGRKLLFPAKMVSQPAELLISLAKAGVSAVILLKAQIPTDLGVAPLDRFHSKSTQAHQVDALALRRSPKPHCPSLPQGQAPSVLYISLLHVQVGIR